MASELEVPSFPSLYNPVIELQTNNSTPPYRLKHSRDVFRFTLYWTLLLYIPLFVFPALVILLAHLSPYRRKAARGKMLVTRKRRSNALILAIAITYVIFGAGLGVVGSAIIGHLLSAVYRVGGFDMSTWVPLLWAVMQALAVVIGAYPSIISII